MIDFVGIENLYFILLDLPVEDFIPLIVGILILRKYLSTKIIDYLVFAMVFIFSYLSELFTYLSRNQDNLIFFQLTFLSVHFTYMWLIVHVHRIKKNQLWHPRFIIEMIIGLLLAIIIMNWELMTQPDNSLFFGISVQRGSSIYFPRGAGIYLLGGQLLVSTAHANLIYLYWVYVNGYAVYSYITMDLKINTQETRRVKLLWIVAFGIAFIWTLSILSFFYISEITNLLIIITFFLEIYIAFRYPEAMLLSHVQINRATDKIEDKYHNFDNITSTENYREKIEEQSQEDPQIADVYLSLDYHEAIELFNQEQDRPQALYILTGSRVVYNMRIGTEFSEDQNGLVGNLLSALLSFSQEILTQSKSNHYRFQTDTYNITVLGLGDLMICYVFEGFPPLAEIRLEQFLRQQQEEEEKLQFWQSLDRTMVSMLTKEQKEKLKSIIDRDFLFKTDN